MSIEWGLDFTEARNENKSLAEIRTETKNKSTQLKSDISKDIISKLNSNEGLEIKQWDSLGYISALTLKGNSIKWDTPGNADSIWPGDKIKIIGKNVFRDSKYNKTDEMVKVWEVINGYTKIEKSEITAEVLEEFTPFDIKVYSDDQIQTLSSKVSSIISNAHINNEWYIVAANWKYEITNIVSNKNGSEDISDTLGVIFIVNWKHNYISFIKQNVIEITEEK